MSRVNERFNVPDKFFKIEIEQKKVFENPSVNDLPATAKVSHLNKEEKADVKEAIGEFNKNLPLGRVILSVIRQTNSSKE